MEMFEVEDRGVRGVFRRSCALQANVSTPRRAEMPRRQGLAEVEYSNVWPIPSIPAQRVAR